RRTRATMAGKGRRLHADARGDSDPDERRRRRDLVTRDQAIADSSPTKAPEPTGVQSVVRAFRLLEYLSEAQAGLSLNELSSLAGLPPATTHRLLRTMSGLGYIRRLPSR